jgi:hypothetical protein
MWLRTLAVLLLLSGTAAAADWEHNNRIQPGENRNYVMPSGMTEDSAILDGRRCGTMSFAYERDIEGTNNVARASLFACPKADSVKADCLLIEAYTTDAFEIISTHRPGFWMVGNITDAGSGGVARMAAYCGKELVKPGGGGSATRFCNVSVESATTTDDIMCGKATTDLTLVRLTCHSTSAGTQAHQVRVFECTSSGGTCSTGTGLNVTLAGIDQETITPTSNDTIETDNWFQIATHSFTTPAAWVHCQLEYTE